MQEIQEQHLQVCMLVRIIVLLFCGVENRSDKRFLALLKKGSASHMFNDNKIFLLWKGKLEFLSIYLLFMILPGAN